MARLLAASLFLHITLVAPCVLATSFLQPASPSRAELESSVLSELAAAKYTDAAEKERIDLLASKLQLMYATVPKNRDGTVSPAAVRYVLHRFFAKHRGWYIRGLEPHGKIRNETREAQQQEWMPSYLQDFFQQVIGANGLKLKELAMFVAILEDFIHKEENGWVKYVYSLLSYSTNQTLSANEVQKVIEAYWMLYNYDGKLLDSVEELSSMFHKKFKGWNETTMWLTKLQKTIWGADPNRRMNFSETTNVAKVVGQSYGEFNNIECLKMKRELLRGESRKPGRVRLADFYKMALHGTWSFNEKMPYLRALGALDESVPDTPLVIVPNYVASKTKCLTTSSFYSHCCRNECEDVLDVLEREIQTPDASSAQIVKTVQRISSSTVAAPRHLSTSLIQRLQEVAQVNGGHVPLHGRMFAQWLHHAFPRECPFPHEGGTTNPQTPDEWMKGTGENDAKATDEEMLSHLRRDNCRLTKLGIDCHHGEASVSHDKIAPQWEDDDDDLPWSPVEELLVIRPPELPAYTSRISSYLKQLSVFLFLFGALSAIVAVAGLRPSSKQLLASDKVRCNI